MQLRSALLLALITIISSASTRAQTGQSLITFIEAVGGISLTPEVGHTYPITTVFGSSPPSVLTTGLATGDYYAAVIRNRDPFGRVVRFCGYPPLPYDGGQEIVVYLEEIPLACWTRMTIPTQNYSTIYETFGPTGVRTNTAFYNWSGFSQGVSESASSKGQAPLYGMEDTNADGVIDVGEASFAVSGLPLEALGFTFKHVVLQYESELDVPTYLQQAGSTLPPSLLDIWSGVLIKPDWYDDAADAVIASVLDDTPPGDVDEVDAKLDVVRTAKQAYRAAFDLDLLGLSGQSCDALIWRESVDYVFESNVHYCVPADSAFALNGTPEFEDGARLTVGPSADAFAVESSTTFKLGSGVDIEFHRPVVATGTSSSPIRFERRGAQAWGSITLADDGNDLSHVTLDGGAQNLVVRSQGNVFDNLTSENSSVGLETSAYEVCSSGGGTCYVQQSEFTLTNSTIQNNTYEGILRLNYGLFGTVGVQATATITNTDITGNGGAGVLVVDGVTVSGSTVTINGGSKIYSNGGSGIGATSAEIVIADETTEIYNNAGSGVAAGSSSEVYITEAKIYDNTAYGVSASYYTNVEFEQVGAATPAVNATVEGNLLGGLFADDHSSIDAGTFAKGECASACFNSILQSTDNNTIDVKATGSSTVLAQSDWWGLGVTGAADLDLDSDKGSFIEVEPVLTSPPGGGSSARPVAGSSTAKRSPDSLRVMVIEARAAAAEADYTEAYRLLRDVIRDGDGDFRRLAYTEATRLLRQARPAGVMTYLESVASGSSAYRPWALRALTVAYEADGRLADAEGAAATLADGFGETRHALFGHLAGFHLRLQAGDLASAEVALVAAQADWPEHQAVIAAAEKWALMQGNAGRPSGATGGMHASRDGAATQAKRGDDGSSVAAFALGAAYPNPGSGRVTVPLTLAEASTVSVAVYDVLGRRVAVLADGPLAAGQHRLRFEADGLPSGLYVVRAEAEGASATQSLVLTR